MNENDESIRALLEEIDTASPTPERVSAHPDAGPRSAAVSVDPRAPPNRRIGESVLPAVLVHSDLVDRVIAGGKDADLALGEILRLGDPVIPAVFAKFPGPLSITRIPADLDLPWPADCGPVLRIISAMRRLALPFLAVRSADKDPQVRFWATYLLGDLHYADAGAALLPRLFDEHDPVRRMATRSARALIGSGEPGIPIREGLSRMVQSRAEPERAKRMAVSAVGQLNLFRCVPAVIDALDDRDTNVATAALHTLKVLTDQDFGTQSRLWSQWWSTKGAARFLR
jgi:hypothetical protein